MRRFLLAARGGVRGILTNQMTHASKRGAGTHFDSILLFKERFCLTKAAATRNVGGFRVCHPESRNEAMELNGAEITVRCLKEEGVEYVFGYPGGAVLFIYDELFKQSDVKHILVPHEQGAVHAADVYARSTDKVGGA